MKLIYAENGHILKEIFKHHSQHFLNDKLYSYDQNLPNFTCGSSILIKVTNIIKQTNIINQILYYYTIQKSAWTSIIEKALLDMSTIDFLNYIWSETIGSLEDVLELAQDDDSQKKVLKITNQQVGS